MFDSPETFANGNFHSSFVQAIHRDVFQPPLLAHAFRCRPNLVNTAHSRLYTATGTRAIGGNGHWLASILLLANLVGEGAFTTLGALVRGGTLASAFILIKQAAIVTGGVFTARIALLACPGPLAMLTTAF